MVSDRVAGVLGWAGIACVTGGLIVRLTMPEQEEVWYWALIAGIVVIGLYGLTQWREVVTFFGRRQARYGALAGSSVLLALGIVVAVNFVLTRQARRWDLTAAKQYSLSDQTLQILDGLEAPLQMKVFAQDIQFQGYRDRLAAYEYASGQVSLDYVDPDKNPIVARQYEIQSYGTVVLEYEGRLERVLSDQEQELTNALIKVIEGEEQTVYFIQGHGERSPDDTERNGYSELNDALRLDNFLVETLVLAQTGEVPADASVVVVAGPTTDYLAPEVDLLRSYLDTGGKVLLLLDPSSEPDAADQPNLAALTAEWGIELGQDVVVDVSGVGQLLGTGVTVPVAAPPYPTHAITEDFRLLTAFPLARSVRPVTGGQNGRLARSFVETSSRSWAETSMEELASGEVTGDGDPQGPISIGAAVSVAVDLPEPADESADDDPAGDDPAGDEAADAGAAPEVEDDETPSAPPQARVAVIGDSDFATNSFIGTQGNRDFALNTVNWLAQQENLISIRPREPEDRRITLTAAQTWNIQLLSIAIIPLAVFGTGVYTWWRRR